jgi:transcriptional regulator with XRE-family HTH domain
LRERELSTPRPGCPQPAADLLPTLRALSSVWLMRSDWDDKATAMERDQTRIGPYPAAGLLRRARRIADLSQRELADAAKVCQSTVARIESGERAPSLSMMQRLIAPAGLYLVVVDGDGRIVLPMRECEETLDGANRHYPSHLDTILDPRPGEWWGDEYGLARPPETFHRNRRYRDYQRALSQWEVRAKQNRGVPPPRHPDYFLRLAQQVAEASRLERERPTLPNSDEIDVDEWDGD